MTLPPVAPELAARLANYMIDDRARAVLQELAPVLEPHLGTAVDEVIAGAARLQQVAEIYQKHSARIPPHRDRRSTRNCSGRTSARTI